MLTDHEATAVLDLITRRGWAVVATPDGNVHGTSPDGRIYLAWLPEDPSAWSRGIIWDLHVRPEHGPGWRQEFGPDTPSTAVAAFLAALLAPVA
ncbi:DUF317 domain-containing protein [Streptacidiphilus sp. NEAU-YB345]|uniref:DUF317 domain-containing protein n=1 Tax=Streptacidiphilus fuscans TaxID=2789292 RepID=A0A931FFN9_9ACTN|nr:DUF317 domain-containing protein [Streptacidiphilus fuscans]